VPASNSQVAHAAYEERTPSPSRGALRLVDDAATCSCELQADAGPLGVILVLRLAGEIDMATVAVVEQALITALHQQPDDLVVDLTQVSFCCVRGLGLFAAAARTTEESGIGYALSGLAPHLDRVATLLWPGRDCVRYRSVSAALSAARVDQSYRMTTATTVEAATAP
jgi:anti-anti-sigma factor